jgi:hypothetical protein
VVLTGMREKTLAGITELRPHCSGFHQLMHSFFGIANNAHDVYHARGIYGQRIFRSPHRDGPQSRHPRADSDNAIPISVSIHSEVAIDMLVVYLIDIRKNRRNACDGSRRVSVELRCF